MHAAYRRLSPADSPLYRAVQNHLGNFLARCHDDWDFHVCVIDGVLVPEPKGEVRFFAVDELDAGDAETVQARARRRILRAFVRSGILDNDERKERQLWSHGGGFSLDATVCIAANDRRELERLLRCCARPPFAAERLAELDAHRSVVHFGVWWC